MSVITDRRSYFPSNRILFWFAVSLVGCALAPLRRPPRRAATPCRRRGRSIPRPTRRIRARAPARDRTRFSAARRWIRAAQTPLTISLSEAIERGLRYNLGIIDATTTSAAARAARLGALSSLLPTIAARAAKVYEELSLREFGLRIPGLPSSTGSFGFEDVRVTLPNRSTTASCGIGIVRRRPRRARQS